MEKGFAKAMLNRNKATTRWSQRVAGTPGFNRPTNLKKYCYFQKALRTHDPVKALMAVPLCFCVFNAVTGSCFFIFSSALKASAGYLAKSSIVEGRMPAQRCHVPLLKHLPHSHLLPAANALKRINLTSCRRMIKVLALTLVHLACVDLCMCVSV